MKMQKIDEITKLPKLTTKQEFTLKLRIKVLKIIRSQNSNQEEDSNRLMKKIIKNNKYWKAHISTNLQGCNTEKYQKSKNHFDIKKSRKQFDFVNFSQNQENYMKNHKK